MSTKEIINGSIAFAFFDEPKSPPCHGVRLNVKGNTLLIQKEAHNACVEIFGYEGKQKIYLNAEELSEFAQHLMLLAQNMK